MTVEDKRRFLINTAFIILLGGIFYFVFKFCTIYLLPFLIGLLLAVIVQRPAQAIARRTKLKKSMLAVVFVIVLYLATLSLISFICFFAYDRLSHLLSVVPSYLSEISELFGGLSTRFSDLINELPAEIATSIKNLPDTLITKLTDLATGILSSSATAIAKNAPGLLVTIIVTVVASCYFSKDYDVVMSFVHKHTSKKVNRIIAGVKKTFFESILNLGKSYFLLMMITFAELSIGFLVIGVDNPISLAAIVAFVDILPVLGTGAVVIPWAIVSLVSGNIWRAVGLAALYLVITIVRNFLEPKIIGDQVGLHPLITLVAMFVGLRLFGILGMFLLPITIIILFGLERDGVIKIFNKNEAAD